MTFVWMSRWLSTRMFSLSATKATPALARASRNGYDLTQKTGEPRELDDLVVGDGRRSTSQPAPQRTAPACADGGDALTK